MKLQKRELGLLSRMSGKTSAFTLAVLLGALLGPLAAAHGAVYGFELGPRNTTQNASGDTISTTGAGRFDTGLATVAAGGTFVVSDRKGHINSHGTWTATAFDSFDAQGGLNNGLQGGVLKITITLSPNGGTAITGVPMSFTCPFEDGAFDEADDGTTIGDFTKITGGGGAFLLIHP